MLDDDIKTSLQCNLIACYEDINILLKVYDECVKVGGCSWCFLRFSGIKNKEVYWKYIDIHIDL